MIQKKHLDWLTHCPAGDGNFISHLKQANVETLNEALKDKELTKTARKKIEVQIRKKQ